MKKLTFMVVCLVLSLLVSAWVPAPAIVSSSQAAKAAKIPQIQITNKTGLPVTVTFTGVKTYVVTATEKKTTIQVEAGKYNYSYQACDQAKKGSLKVKNNTAKLTIPACKSNKNKAKSGSTASTTVTINNLTGGTLYLTLKGPATYYFTLGLNKTKITVVKGKYTYTAYGCGSSKTGTINLKGNMKWTWYCTH
jgi:hypothetical protein